MGRQFIAALAIAALPPVGGNAPADCTFCDEPRTGPGDGCYPCDEGMCGPSTATTGFGPSDFCPDGRQYLCQTYLTSPSIYVANLTNMTVGMNLTGGSPCPAEWIRDTVIPYPAAPDFECYETYPDGGCVPSMCTGTPTDGGAPCAECTTEATCSMSGLSNCTFYPSCPTTLAPDGTAESCIQLPVLGECVETAAGTSSSSPTDAANCAAVTDLATADACNAVPYAAGHLGTPCLYRGKDWRCYLHFDVAEVLKGSLQEGERVSTVLKRCPLVEMPEVGRQYVFGLSGLCTWRGGDFVALSEVPESFLPMLHGQEQCPMIEHDGRGSVTIVMMFIVVLPIGSWFLIWLVKKMFPKRFQKNDADGEGEGEEDDDVGGKKPIKLAPAPAPAP